MSSYDETHTYPFECDKFMVDFDLEEMACIIRCIIKDIYDLDISVQVKDNSVLVDVDKFRLERYPSGRYKVLYKGTSRWLSVLALNGTHSVKGCHPQDLMKYLVQTYMNKGFDLWLTRNYQASA